MTAPAPMSMPPDEGTPFVLAWYGCDLATGGIAEELRSLSPSGALSRRLGDSTGATFSLDLAGAPRGWEAATDQGRTMLVAVDTATDTPIWAGVVTGPRQGGSANTVNLTASTLETYLEGRYSPDFTAIDVDLGTILEDVLAPALTGGPPFEIDGATTGTTGILQVLDSDDRSLLSIGQELMGRENGPEWTIDPVWADANHAMFKFMIRIRSKIGVQLDDPEAVFDMPGCVRDYSLTEDYTAGHGATRVTAYGDSSDTARLRSAVYQADDLLASGWPLWEHRFTPAAGTTDPDALNAQAAAALRLMKTGARSWSIDATASRGPRLGTGWNLGDNIALDVVSSPRHPNGVYAVARAWAWELDPKSDLVRPILVEGG